MSLVNGSQSMCMQMNTSLEHMKHMTHMSGPRSSRIRSLHTVSGRMIAVFGNCMSCHKVGVTDFYCLCQEEALCALYLQGDVVAGK